MTEEEFIKWLVEGKMEDGAYDLFVPESFYKKYSGEINAEKIMMVVLKARSQRRSKHPKPVQKDVNENEKVGGTI